MELGRVGIWSSQFRSRDTEAAVAAAAELEALGFGALWIPGSAGGDILGDVARALGATSRLAVATGILNVWMHDADEVAALHSSLTAAHPGRFLLGLGVSHAMLVDAQSAGRYRRPMAVMTDYLDRLDAADRPVPPAERVLAALGPKMLELARERTAGAHPYLTDATHTAQARATLGAGPLLAPELMVVVSTDPGHARAVARTTLALYLQLPNYTNNLRRLGYTDDDLAGEGSDRLVDGIVAWGDPPAIADRVRSHLDAGADHVCLQVLTEDARQFPLADWRALATVLPALS